MRIDLYHGGQRPLPLQIWQRWIKFRAGIIPGALLALTYRTDLLGKELADYTQRAMHGSGGWSKGDAELFAAFVSTLNSCQF